jgi:hypothetical protein
MNAMPKICQPLRTAVFLEVTLLLLYGLTLHRLVGVVIIDSLYRWVLVENDCDTQFLVMCI